MFSVDELRGRLTREVLERSGFQVLLLNKILGMRDKIVRHGPDVVIFDTCRCFSEEIRHLKALCGVLGDMIVILLGDPTIIEGFQRPCLSKALCLSDPLDLDRMVAIIKDILLPKAEEQNSAVDRLEGELKGLLKLC